MAKSKATRVGIAKADSVDRRTRTPPAPLAAGGRGHQPPALKRLTQQPGISAQGLDHQSPGTHWRPEDDGLHHLVAAGRGRAEVVVLAGRRREGLVPLQQRPRAGLAGPAAGRCRRHGDRGTRGAADRRGGAREGGRTRELGSEEAAGEGWRGGREGREENEGKVGWEKRGKLEFSVGVASLWCGLDEGEL